MQFGTRKLLLSASIAAVLCALFVAARSRYYADRVQVRSALAGVKGISDVTPHSHVDVLEEVNSTSVKLDGIPDSVITFGGFGNYEDTGMFSIGRVGKWRFRVHGRRQGVVFDADTGEPIESEYSGGHIMFGPASPYNKLLPFEINTVQDLVDHYVDLIDVLATWPSESEPGSVILDDGSTQFYFVIEDPLPKN